MLTATDLAASSVRWGRIWRSARIWKLQDLTTLATWLSMVKQRSKFTPKSLTASENLMFERAAIMPIDMSTAFSLAAVPKTIASVLVGFNSRPLSKNHRDIISAVHETRQIVHQTSLWTDRDINLDVVSILLKAHSVPFYDVTHCRNIQREEQRA